jgi:transposase InsO family protein
MPGLKPETYEERRPTTLLDPDRFIAALVTDPPVLEANKYIQPLTDGQLLNQISDETLAIDPLQWPPGYELNNDLVLTSKETGRVWVPPTEEIQQEVLRAHHDGKIAGHLGTLGTLELVSRKYWWKDMVGYVKQYVQGCYACARNKTCNQKPVGLLQPLPNPEGPWLWTQSDFIVQLPPSRGYDAIYVIADQLTKMAHFILCKTMCTAEQLAELHIKHVWPLHGLPLQHNTDRGPQFAAPYMKNLYQALGIDQRLSTVYHPKSQGQVESNNKWLETYLQIFSTYRQDDWVDYLHTAEFAYNNHFHPSIQTTPFYANYGYHPVYTDRASPEQILDTPLRIQHIYEVQARCQLALEKAQKVYKRYTDRHQQDLSFAIRDRVWLEAYNLSTDAPSKKLAAKRLGPYTVTGLVGPSSYQLDIPIGWRLHNVFHAGLLSQT